MVLPYVESGRPDGEPVLLIHAGVVGAVVRPGGRVKQPAVVVPGGASPPVVHRLVAHVAGLLAHGSTATVPGAGHLLPLTHPAQLAAIVAG